MPDQEDIEAHLRMVYGEPAVEDVDEQEQTRIRERERALSDYRRVRLRSGREVSVSSVKVEFTWDGSMEGFPSEDSIRLKLWCYRDKGHVLNSEARTLGLWPMPLPSGRVHAYEALPPVTVTVRLYSQPFGDIVGWSWLTVIWFQDEVPTDILGEIRKRVRGLDWQKLAEDGDF